MRADGIALPPIFLDRLAHAILRVMQRDRSVGTGARVQDKSSRITGFVNPVGELAFVI